jgi:hypothetical protein
MINAFKNSDAGIAIKRMSKDDIEKSFQWLLRQSPEIGTMVLKRFENNQTDSHQSQMELSETIARVINQVRKEIRLGTQRKNPNRDLERLSDIHKMRLAKIRQNFRKKGKPKLQTIRRHFDMIMKLRSEKVSWRDIAEYLARYCEVNVSYSYLRRGCNEILEDRADRNNEISK